MPSINNKHCPKHGTYQSKRCEECASEYNKQYDKTMRNKEASNFYNSRAWRNVSKSFLTSNPVCLMCGSIAQHSDHIVAIKDGGDKYSFSNLQPLCIACHNSKEIKAGNRW